MADTDPAQGGRPPAPDEQPELDRLYAAEPREFTALRSRLAAAARNRGDADAARRIAAARKPTTAAHCVNVLVLDDPGVRDRLAALGDQLRAAHAAGDGQRIRELTGRQRRLIGDLTRAALQRAGVGSPSAALRDDITATLQAAVADPGVAARLGRLTRAEQWSGFGEFGSSAAVFTASRGKAGTGTEPDGGAEHAGTKPADEALAAAEHARRDAGEALARAQSDLAAAARDEARAAARTAARLRGKR